MWKMSRNIVMDLNNVMYMKQRYHEFDATLNKNPCIVQYTMLIQHFEAYSYT